MKKIAMFLVFLPLMNASALSSCPVQIGQTDDYMGSVVRLINKQQTCAQANTVAQVCALGSSADVSFVAAAMVPCEKRINAATNQRRQMVRAVYDLCEKKFARSKGTLGMSAKAFCQLNTAKFFDDLFAPSYL